MSVCILSLSLFRHQLAVNLTATQLEIAGNRASPVVVQLHCFCRQIRALYLMGNFPQLIERATAFIASFARTLEQLHEMTGAVESHQPHLWAVGACLEIAYACELSWNGHDYQVSSASVPAQAAQAISPEALSRYLGDLLYLARRVLVRFAKAMDPQRTTERRSSAEDDLRESSSGDDAESPRAWYQWLEHVFAARTANSERVQRCVWEVSHLASLHYSRAGRHRFAVFLGAECAHYHVRRREFESASRLFRSHSRQCEEDKWWMLVGDCVRHICSAELELGRAAEAVAACFSMLAATEDAKAEIGREYLETMMHTLVQRLDQRASSAKLSMGDLLKPSVALETMQTSGSDLDYGEVRVKVRVTNCFPAGVNLEQLRVRFSKHKMVTAGNDSDSDELATDSAPQRLLYEHPHVLSVGTPATELPRLHSLVIGEDGSPREHSDDSGRDRNVADQVGGAPPLGEDVESPVLAVSITSVAYSAGRPETSPLLALSASIVDADVQLVDEDSRASGDDDASDELVLLESNVFLCEKASVDLEFFQSGLGVGHYACSGVDCVLAGNTFNLAPGAALSLGFEIPRRESTLRIVLTGPPLLTPLSVEQVCVAISAQSDTVADGVLELSCVGDRVAVQLLRAELQTAALSAVRCSVKSDVEAIEAEPKDKLLLSIPSMAPGETLVYRVWLSVGDTDENESNDDDDNDDDDNAVVPTPTVSATLRYQHTTSAESNVALRRADAAFRTLRPLTDSVRLQRVASKVVAAIALKCNSECGLVLRDYRLEASAVSVHDHTSSNRISATTDSSHLTVLHDPNGRLRNTRLQPGETVHVAFTLADTGGQLPDEARLALDLEFDADNDASRNTTQWERTLVVRLPLASVRGARYRIEVEPKRTGHAGLEVAVGEEVAFHVVVRAFSDSESPTTDEDAVVLCLDERSERDWILVGKARERVSFQQSRSFATLRRLVATRVGRVRFPSFHLRALQGEKQRIAAARVECPHAVMQVTVV